MYINYRDFDIIWHISLNYVGRFYRFTYSMLAVTLHRAPVIKVFLHFFHQAHNVGVFKSSQKEKKRLRHVFLFKHSCPQFPPSFFYFFFQLTLFIFTNIHKMSIARIAFAALKVKKKRLNDLITSIKKTYTYFSIIACSCCLSHGCS